MEGIFTLTDVQAFNAGANLSAKLRKDTFVVAYNDAKNERIVLNIYPNTAANVRRIAGQIKMYKNVRVFERGRRLDDSMFKGA